ncbi:helix-turn-helix domain-containing protein [Sphingomonas profundi]|uniref:LuxR C-terminal-related transcriptional regulator n=1 Tax=Alterirhizorhabdus profundi TaxID=2681549 RepID=UPI0018D16A20
MYFASKIGEQFSDCCSAISPREQQCLALISKGYSDARASEALGITRHTVRFHVRNICHKLKAIVTFTNPQMSGIGRGRALRRRTQNRRRELIRHSRGGEVATRVPAKTRSGQASTER